VRRAPPFPGEVVNVTPRCRCGRLLRATAGWMVRCEVCRNGRCRAVYQGRRCRRPVGHRGCCHWYCCPEVQSEGLGRSEHYRQIVRLFDWTFTRADLERVLAKITEGEPRLALGA
jgi:hypothetical protein